MELEINGTYDITNIAPTILGGPYSKLKYAGSVDYTIAKTLGYQPETTLAAVGSEIDSISPPISRKVTEYKYLVFKTLNEKTFIIPEPWVTGCVVSNEVVMTLSIPGVLELKAPVTESIIADIRDMLNMLGLKYEAVV